jgi:hypothetical protein
MSVDGTGAAPGGGGTPDPAPSSPDPASSSSAGPAPDPTSAAPASPTGPPSPGSSSPAPASEWARPAEGAATPPPVEAWAPPVPPPNDQPAQLFPFPQPPPAADAYPQPGYPPPGYPPPGYPAPGAYPAPGQYAQYPQPGWPPAVAAPPRGRRGLLTGVIVAAVAVIGLLCTSSIYMMAEDQHDSTSADGGFGQEDPFSWPTGLPFPSARPTGEPAPESTGPQPAASPAKDIYDLNAVCDDNAFFPDAPKHAGKAPHPVALLIKDGESAVRWNNRTYYLDDIGTGKAAENTWGPNSPAKVQLAACLDRTSAGSKLRTCKYDEPEPDTLTLYRASWRLRVFEVATRKQLLDKKLASNETACPFSVLVGPDKKIYAEVSDHTLVSTLKSLVTK